MERNAEAEAIWKDFASSVVVPFPYCRARGHAYAGRTDDIAYTTCVFPGHPEFRGQEYAQIVFGTRFPDDRDDRLLTLLHESIHLATFMVSLRRMYEVKADLCRRYDFSVDLVRLAFLLADQLFEADAEFFLKTKYSERAAVRAKYYSHMQRRAFRDRPWARLPENDRPYAMLGYLLRLDLALSLVGDDDVLKPELSIFRTQLAEELWALNLTMSTRALLQRLESILSPTRADFAAVAVRLPKRSGSLSHLR